VGQPVEQLTMLYGGDRAGQPLIHRVMHINQPWNDDMAFEVDNFISTVWNRSCFPDGNDLIPFYQNTGVAYFTTVGIHANHTIGVPE